MNNLYEIQEDITVIYAKYEGEEVCITINTEDLDLVSQYSWWICKGRNTLYAVSTSDKTWMHRLILGLTKEDKLVGDHKDGNGLNNTRDNLRPLTLSQNNANRQRKSTGTTSKYLNVYYHNQNNKWTARVKVDGKTHTLGSYTLEWVAALVALEYKKKVYGDDFVIKSIEKELLDLKSKYPQEYEESIRESELCKRYKGRANVKTTSGIPGVVWRESRKRWMVFIKIDGKPVGFGQYKDVIEAGRVANIKTIKYLGSPYAYRVPIKLD